VLKPGGELYLSDVFADRRLPLNLQQHKVLLEERLGAALYEGDFELLMQKVGFNDCRIISKQPLNIEGKALQTLTNNIKFYSVTVRSFKLKLESRRENYAQFARYLGTIAQSPDSFKLDGQLQFKAELPVPVDGNTATILKRSRLARHFKVHGGTKLHYGSFNDICNGTCSDQPDPANTKSSMKGC
jgi:hypothetical protein